MIEDLLREHIESKIIAAFPSWKTSIEFPEGSLIYGRKKGLKVIGSEQLAAAVTVHASAPVDRREFIRLFPRREIDLEDYTAFQEYKSHTLEDAKDTEELYIITFFINYIYDILEA